MEKRNIKQIPYKNRKKLFYKNIKLYKKQINKHRSFSWSGI